MHSTEYPALSTDEERSHKVFIPSRVFTVSSFKRIMYVHCVNVGELGILVKGDGQLRFVEKCELEVWVQDKVLSLWEFQGVAVNLILKLSIYMEGTVSMA
jgi:hypothetical protein